MGAHRLPVSMTVDEFLDWEPAERADHRWHLVDGEPVCMAPASENHGAIQSEATIPTVQEILLLASTRIEAELLRRDAAGAWPEGATILRDGDEIELASIGFRAPLRAFYATTSLMR
jgi:Uma2 family endonuclease